MGTNVSKGPITKKETFEGKTSHFRYGACEMQGWRRTMEDAIIAMDNFDGNQSHLFGIMDGHGGM